MRKGTDLGIPTIVLDRRSREPLQHQIVRQISAAVRDGTLAAGARLPSSRLMAGLLGVSRNTVVTAYDELASRGLLQCKSRSTVRIAATERHRPPTTTALYPVREAHFPARILLLRDPDGNLLYLNF